MPTPPYSASTIAKWFLAWASFEDEGALSNLKLQKLLYYAKGHYMAAHGGTPLFSDPMQAWSHGPVVPNVYREYRDFKGSAITFDQEFDFGQIDDETNSYLERVWQTFGSMSAWKLREMTHHEDPWMDAFRDGEQFIPISDKALSDYFGKLHASARRARHSA